MAGSGKNSLAWSSKPGLEALELVAGEHHAQKVRCDALHALHRELAKAQVVAHAARQAVGLGEVEKSVMCG